MIDTTPSFLGVPKPLAESRCVICGGPATCCYERYKRKSAPVGTAIFLYACPGHEDIVKAESLAPHRALP